MMPGDGIARPGLEPGARIGHYQIVSLLGKGGMGEVWRARDPVLHRDVAIKALPSALSADPQRLARLEREAQILAALRHPNIAAIYGVETWQHTRVLVLELVEGQTLDERLLSGPLPGAEVLPLALQIAESLEAAHDKGIVHRDLKPSNIKVTPDGHVKVLDFGLAKPVERAPHDAATITDAHAVMGTAAYMSPEQARGEAAGRQSDIWAFGVVLYELLSGKSPFGKSSSAETFAQILRTEADLAALPGDTPPRIRRLLQRCLERDTRRRLQHIGDARIEIEDELAGAAEQPDARNGPSSRRPLLLAAAALGLLAVGVTVWQLGLRTTTSPASRPLRLSIPFAGPPVARPFGIERLAISDDGSLVAYCSTDRVWVRRMTDPEPVAVVEAEAVDPFFSPDGAWLGVFEATRLIKVPSGGGPREVLAEISDRPAGGAWGKDGTIVFATTEGLYSVPANGGGQPRLLLRPDREREERQFAWPSFLPDGRSLLYTVLRQGPAASGQVALLDLRTLQSRVVLAGASTARYVPTGHLVYLAGSLLQAIAFNTASGQTSGAPISIPDVGVGFWQDNGAAEFAVSQSGTLVYHSAGFRYAMSQLTWVGRDGKEEAVPIKPGVYAYPRVSPDGTRVAMDGISGANRDIWIVDLQRLSLTRLTEHFGEDLLAEWAPDGTRVFFSSEREGNFDIYSQAADGSGQPTVVLSAPGFQSPLSISPDGRQLVIYDQFKDVRLLNLDTHQTAPLLNGNADERLARLSPDRKWLVYESDESGRQFEIYVRPFPDVARRREQISVDGGRFPRWSRTGNELFYVDLEGSMTAVPFRGTPDARIGQARKLFTREKPPQGRAGWPYDISARDERFIFLDRVLLPTSDSTQVSVVLNFFEDLRTLLQPH
jgi:serine/threonine-protein kinase